MSVIGITEEVKIKIENVVCYLALLVIDYEDHDVILGLDWFQNRGVSSAKLFNRSRF